MTDSCSFPSVDSETTSLVSRSTTSHLLVTEEWTAGSSLFNVYLTLVGFVSHFYVMVGSILPPLQIHFHCTFYLHSDLPPMERREGNYAQYIFLWLFMCYATTGIFSFHNWLQQDFLEKLPEYSTYINLYLLKPLIKCILWTKKYLFTCLIIFFHCNVAVCCCCVMLPSCTEANWNHWPIRTETSTQTIFLSETHGLENVLVPYTRLEQFNLQCRVYLQWKAQCSWWFYKRWFSLLLYCTVPEQVTTWMNTLCSVLSLNAAHQSSSWQVIYSMLPGTQCYLLHLNSVHNANRLVHGHVCFRTIILVIF